MRIGAMGRIYEDGAIVVESGEPGDCMYVVQKGKVDVILRREEGDLLLSTLTVGDTFGEMALFTKQPRSAAVLARGEARILRIDKRQFIRRIQQDPSLAFMILKKLSERIDHLNHEVSRLQE